jgi:hypothetical protein
MGTVQFARQTKPGGRMTDEARVPVGGPTDPVNGSEAQRITAWDGYSEAHPSAIKAPYTVCKDPQDG